VLTGPVGALGALVHAAIDTAQRSDAKNLIDRLIPQSSLEVLDAGLSVSQAAAVHALDNFSGTSPDAARSANIAAIYDSLQVRRTDIQAAALVRRTSRNGDYCASYDSCESGGQVPAGSIGVRIAMSRVGVVAEVEIGGQFTSHRESDAYDDAFAHRRSRGSLLLRYVGIRPTERSYDLLAGATLTVADTRGVSRLKHGFAPLAGRHPIAERSTTLGFTAGISAVFPITHAVSVILPVRVTFTPSTPLATWPGRLDAQGGIGLSFGAAQRVRIR
jgi:hypothetical protein